MYASVEHIRAEGLMRIFARTTFVLLLVVLAPSFARAQAAINGVVKDSSGALLPGVTVEASSPALIEKIRSAVTDGGGQYHIENLRPGTYAITFTLPGFSTVKREGIELTGSFTATVNADLKVGAVNEPVSSIPSRLTVLNPGSVNVIAYVPGRRFSIWY